MAKDAGTAGAEMVPLQQNQGSTQRIFGHIIDAISQIQQYAVIEETEDVPDDFLTIRGKLNFFNIGFGNGFMEGITFGILTAIVLPIMSDPTLLNWVSSYFPLAQYKIFLWLVNCVPIVISGGICCFLSQFRVGTITKKSVDSLIIGRTFSLMIKGALIFVVLLYFSSKISANSAWAVAGGIFDNIIIKRPDLAKDLYRIIWNMKPHLIITAYEVLAIFVVSAIIPFISMYIVSAYRAYKVRKVEQFWED